ncbi:MAG: hypothetical protein HY894_08970 [Deltaproteobacteria bacterium]|nr:hypothetical protein [Deltaproteobacteria bacterium]
MHLERTATLLNSLSADRELATRLLMEKERDALGLLAKDVKAIRLAAELRTTMEQMVRRSAFFTGLSLVDMATGRRRTTGELPQDIIERAVSDIRRSGEKTLLRPDILPNGERVLLIGQTVGGQDKNPRHGGVLLGVVKLTMSVNSTSPTGCGTWRRTTGR